jgi:hypothetical protein
MEDPCQAAARASQECMDKANYNRDEVSHGAERSNSSKKTKNPSPQCLTFFQAYRDCKGKWVCLFSRSRRYNG